MAAQQAALWNPAQSVPLGGHSCCATWGSHTRTGAIRAAVENVVRVSSQGVTPGDADTVLSILSVAFEEDAAGGGAILLMLAGDGAIRLQVEDLEVALRDVTKPYAAVSGKVPDHPA